MRRDYASHLLLHYKLRQNLAAKKNKHLLSHSVWVRKMAWLGDLWLMMSQKSVIKVSAEALKALLGGRSDPKLTHKAVGRSQVLTGYWPETLVPSARTPEIFTVGQLLPPKSVSK